MAKCVGWCPPAIIYAVLAVISLVLSITMEDPFMGTVENTREMRIVHTIFHAFMLVFWTGVIYYLCSTCHQYWAWAVLLFPLIVGIVLLGLGTALITASYATRGVRQLGQ